MPRTPEQAASYRREALLAALARLWEHHPDWRLGQILHNLESDCTCLFSLEDDVLFDRANALYRETPRGKQVQEGLAECICLSEEMGAYDVPQGGQG